MANAVNILDQGFACLVDNLGVIDAEYFISLIKRDDFDYMVWQREYFDKMAFAGETLIHSPQRIHSGELGV